MAERKYFLTGNLSSEIFADDCRSVWKMYSIMLTDLSGKISILRAVITEAKNATTRALFWPKVNTLKTQIF